MFIAEGRFVVRRLIERRRYVVRSLLVNEATARSFADLFASLDESVPVYVCDASVLAGITGHDIHRGCLALAERPAGPRLAAVLEPLERAPGDRGLLVVLEGVTNADNVGGVFRNAAAFGAGAVLLSPTCCDPLYRKAIRTSMGATLDVPYARVDDWPAGLAALRACGFTLVAMSPREPAVTLDVFAAASRAPRLALMIGTEGSGLSAEAEESADVRVRIPIAPGVDSLNLAVAAGIALHRLAPQLPPAR